MKFLKQYILPVFAVVQVVLGIYLLCKAIALFFGIIAAEGVAAGVIMALKSSFCLSLGATLTQTGIVTAVISEDIRKGKKQDKYRQPKLIIEAQPEWVS